MQIGMLKPFIFGNRFAETDFLPVTERPIVSGIIVTVAQRLLSVDRLLLHGGRGSGPHTRRTGRRRRETKDSGVSKR